MFKRSLFARMMMSASNPSCCTGYVFMMECSAATLPIQKRMELFLPLTGTAGLKTVFERDAAGPLQQTLERLRFSFEPSPVAPPSSDTSPPPTSKKGKLPKLTKEQRLARCPEAFVFPADDPSCAPLDPTKFNNEQGFRHGHVVQVGEQRWTLVHNAARIKRFLAPPMLMEGCPCVPRDITTWNVSDAARELKWRWTVVGEKALPDEGTVCTEMVFVPPRDLVGRTFMISCTDGTQHTLSVETGPVLERPCPLQDRVHHDKLPAASPSSASFRVVTYNVLHDAYADSTHAREVLYPYVDPELLKLRYRELRLGEELSYYDADVVCLQEVGTTTYRTFFRPLHRGFGAVFEGKTRSGKEEPADEGAREGCAVFWRTSRFEHVDTVTVPLTMAYFGTTFAQTPFWQDVHARLQSGEYPYVLEALREVTTIGVAVMLRERSTGRLVVVLNAHLFWHPLGAHIRLLQARMIAEVIHTLRGTVPGAAAIIGGDLNSVADGIVYELYTAGSVSAEHRNWKDSLRHDYNSKTMSNDDTMSTKKLFALDVAMPEGLALRDACHHWDAKTHTNYTPGFQARLDYVFVTPDTLRVDHVLDNPDVDEMRRGTALPSASFPSDHVAVVVDLSLC